jgi:hypothetical protein
MKHAMKWALAAVLVLTGSNAFAELADAAGSSSFEKDREAILSMAGEYVVTFEFEETVTLDPDAESSPRDLSRALEKVFLVEDRGDFISLQHILLTGDGDGEDNRIVKHWRQDWAYENTNMLVFRSDNHWEWEKVPKKAAKGTWSQTVYQVDDSPRYSGYGQWRHIGDYSFWESSETWRPLPRREKKIRDDYDVLMSKNRQSLTPYGWLHEQDNYKLALDKEGNRVIAREIGHNPYRRVDDQAFSRIVEYWNETKDFWKVVRAEWQTLFEAHPAFVVETDPIGEKKLYERVFGHASDFADGKQDEAIAAMKETLAESIIAE